MDVYLLDKSFNKVRLVENYESLIWTERYDDHGDFVMKASLASYRPGDFPIDYYLENRESNELMIIEESEIQYTDEEGSFLEVRARALSSILNRRIVWAQTELDSLLEPAVKKLLDQNVIAATTTARRIPNLSFAYAGATVPSIYTVEAQFLGTKIDKAIRDICEPYDVGFRVLHSSLGQFQFRLYGGVNRSYEQSILPRVVFSPEFDNLEQAQYLKSKIGYVNAVLVGGEGEGNKKKFRTINRSNTVATGLSRYEDYETASSISSNGETVSAAKYNAYLDSVGKAYLKDHGMQIIFEGKTDRGDSARFGVDYLLGDLVQISDGDSINSSARIVEYVRSYDRNGYQAYPALRIKED